jgi:hypothetical protein
MNNFVKRAIDAGGKIRPLIIPNSLTQGTGLMNPSIFNDGGKIIGVLRHVNYTFYHSEKKLFLHPWGPLTYLHPENDCKLRTRNFYYELDSDLSITRFNEIDMSFGDKRYTPCWEFVGLEDARIFRWHEKLWICGVRRDVKPNGEGRMELCGIDVGPDSVREISRFRIPPPKDPNSYCEKNWMPVLDMPYHYVKWTCPTELVVVDPGLKTCKTVAHVDNRPDIRRDIRGGTQVIPFGQDGYRMAITHEVDLFKSEVGRKDAVYYHRFVVWDKDWNIVKTSRSFFMMDGRVEFSIGMCHSPYKPGSMLITFGFQDNAAYVLEAPLQTILDFIDEQN